MGIANSDGDILHYYHLVPIGAIIPWAKTFNNTPILGEAWVECDGSEIVDSESPFNGENSPNLNSFTNMFLSGSNISGQTGGTSSHTHPSNPSGQGITDPGTSYGDLPASHIPPFYSVVFIMRIK